jgi:uncharacterized protein involved in exopolysaccharide biosynthesis
MTTPPIIHGSPVSGPDRRFGPAYAVFITVFLIVMIMATAITYILPESYASTARVKVEAASPPADSYSYGGYFPPVELEIIQSQLVLSNVIKKLDLNAAWGKKYFGGENLKTAESMQILRERLSLAIINNSRIIAITVYSDDRREAALLANAVAGAYQDYYATKPRAADDVLVTVSNKETSQAVNSVAGEHKVPHAGAVVTIIDDAVPADRPCRPNKPLDLALGAVMGVVLGAGVAWLVGMLNRRR